MAEMNSAKAAAAAVGNNAAHDFTLHNQPAFIVGVTGYMDLGDCAALPERLRHLFLFLRHGNRTAEGIEASKFLKSELAPLENIQGSSKKSKRTAKFARTYEQFFDAWPGLGDMPVVVLSSLAPGADQAVANVATEQQFKDLGFYLRCPLAFPLPLYRQASTFVRGDGPADKQRLEELRKIAPDDNDERCFAVAIEDEFEMTAEERNARYHNDLGDPQRRRRRYQAAGEYVAAYSHLLIAIWDHIDDTKHDRGTAAIVQARRGGLTSGLLPTTPLLPLPSGGPTLHLFTKRESRKTIQPGQPDANPDPCWSLRWLFPYRKRTQIAELAANWVGDCDANWQHAGLTEFVRTTELLLEFSRRAQVDPDKLKDHLRGFLTCDRLQLYDLPELAPLIKIVHPVADLRLRASTEQRDKELPQTEMTLKWLFWLTLSAAILFDAFSHWHAQIDSHAMQTPPLAASPDDTDSANTDGQEVIVSTPDEFSLWILIARLGRFLIGLAATGFALRAIWFFRQKRSERHDAKGHDLRALAEGARVQMVWHLAGLGRSVSANYMERQRGELTWIRSAIRSVAMPYERARWAFGSLLPETKIQVLKCIFHNWLRGHAKKAQADYFESAQQEKIHEIHFWHKVGSVLVIAGLMLSSLQVAAALAVCWNYHMLEQLSDWCWSQYFCWLWLALAVPLVFLINCWKRLGWRTLQHKYLDPWIDWLIPNEESQQFAHDATLFKRCMTRNFGRLAVWSAVCAVPVFLLAVLLQHASTLLPGITDWVIILSASLLILGGLSIAWPERNLFSELAYQYGTMHYLFESAANKVELMIKELETLYQLMTDESAAGELADRRYEELTDEKKPEFRREHEIAAIQKHSADEFPRVVRRIQNALYELGQEALDENAEWLLLHRARPLEPVVAG